MTSIYVKVVAFVITIISGVFLFNDVSMYEMPPYWLIGLFIVTLVLSRPILKLIIDQYL